MASPKSQISCYAVPSEKSIVVQVLDSNEPLVASSSSGPPCGEVPSVESSVVQVLHSDEPLVATSSVGPPCVQVLDSSEPLVPMTVPSDPVADSSRATVSSTVSALPPASPTSSESSVGDAEPRASGASGRIVHCYVEEIRSYEEEHALVKQVMTKSKKILAKMSPSVKQEFVARKRQKEMERTLLPDAPPRNRSRKQSPKRQTCRLVPGTPTTPPAPKLQDWEIRKNKERKRALPSASPVPMPPVATSPVPTSAVTTSPKPDLSTPTSTISLESTVEAPGFSPLNVDWTSDNLSKNNFVATQSFLKRLDNFDFNKQLTWAYKGG